MAKLPFGEHVKRQGFVWCIWPWLLPSLATSAALFLTWSIPALWQHSSVFLFVAAMGTSAWLGGWFPALLATALSTAAIATTMLTPTYSIRIYEGDDLIRLTLFDCVSLLLTALQTLATRKHQVELETGQRLAIAIDSGGFGVWNFHVVTRKFWWSKNLEAIYGRSKGNFPSVYGQFFSLIHFDDQPLFSRAIARTIDEGEDYEIEYRILPPDNSIRWIATRGRVVFNSRNRAVRIVGTSTDITGRKIMMEMWQNGTVAASSHEQVRSRFKA